MNNSLVKFNNMFVNNQWMVFKKKLN
jgi:hypothetical protein